MSSDRPADIKPFPALTTPRLLLREMRPKDVTAFMELLSLPVVTRFSNWPDAPPLDQCDTLISRMMKAYPDGNGCAWAIEDTSCGTLIGAIRINYILKDWKVGGIGYELHPSVWNKGVMTETLRTVVECAHSFFELNRLEAWTLQGNDASDRVLAKVGFRYEGTQRQRGFFKGAFHDFRWFGRIKDDPLTG